MRMLKLGVLLVATLMPGIAAADTFPDRAVKVIVPYAAGGDGDLIARATARKLQEKWQQPVIVDNRPGAGSIIGTEAVAKSAPDGYTLLFTSFGFVTTQLEANKISYDPRSLSPVFMSATSPLILYVNATLPLATLNDVVDYAKKNPGKLTFGSSGNLSSLHLAAELLADATGTKIIHVPYKGVAPAVNDLLAGHVNLMWATPNLMQYVRDGKLRALVAATDRRLSIAPDVPTTVEAGFPAIQIATWAGMLMPLGIPADVQQKIVTDVKEATQSPEAEKQITTLEYIPMRGSRADFEKFLEAELAKWGKIIREHNLKGD